MMNREQFKRLIEWAEHGWRYQLYGEIPKGPAVQALAAAKKELANWPTEGETPPYSGHFGKRPDPGL